MTPILHRDVIDLINDAIDYDKGILRLSECIDCTTTEKLNGEYTLSLTYPIGATGWEEILPGRIIIAKTSESPIDPTQPFTITKIVKNGNSLNVTAQHISYRLNGLLVYPQSAGITTLTALRDYLNVNTARNPFTFYSDSATAIAEPMRWEQPLNVYALIYGGNNSVMKAFSGLFEMRFNRLNVSFSTARGADTGFRIKYGINMLSANQTEEAPDQINAVWPFALLPQNETDKTKRYIDLLYWNRAPIFLLEASNVQDNAVAADVSNQFGAEDYFDSVVQMSAGQATSTFGAYAQKWAAKNQRPAVPSAITVSYIDLARTAEYSFLQRTPVALGDIVTVVYPRYGINVRQEVTSVTYDVLRDSNRSIVIGTPNQTVVEKIAAKLQEGN